MEIVIAAYGAGLATVLAAGQAVASWRRRRRVAVRTGLVTNGLNPEERETARGTPVQVVRGDDVLWEEALVYLTVRNEGGTPVQIVAVVLESLTNTFQLTPRPLPHVLDPGTRIQITMQKEPLDMLDDVTFLGVVDALGRRYAPTIDELQHTVQRSWEMPTRVGKYRRRDDPTAPVVLAYPVRDETLIERTTRPGSKAKPLISRPPLMRDTAQEPE